MSAPTLPIQVPADDPKRKQDQKETDDKTKANEEVKEGEDLVRGLCSSSIAFETDGYVVG